MNCPKCNGENIKFFRKKTEQPTDLSREIMCVCQDCGCKWKRVQKQAAAQVNRVASAPQPGIDVSLRRQPPQQGVSQVQRRAQPQRRVQPQRRPAPQRRPMTKAETVVQWVLMVLLWPVTLSYWFYSNSKVKLNKNIKVGIIAVVWLVVIAGGVGLFINASKPKPEYVLDYSVSTTVNVSTAQLATSTTQKKADSDKKGDKTTTAAADSATATATTAAAQ